MVTAVRQRAVVAGWDEQETAAFAAVRGLDPDLAPPWLWMLAAVVAVALMLAASRVTQVEPE